MIRTARSKVPPGAKQMTTSTGREGYSVAFPILLPDEKKMSPINTNIPVTLKILDLMSDPPFHKFSLKIESITPSSPNLTSPPLSPS
jgi:hypothetical protein